MVDSQSTPEEQPSLRGDRCWAYGKIPAQPCWGKMSVSEDYPGILVFWCEGHGHPEDEQPYRPRPSATPG